MIRVSYFQTLPHKLHLKQVHSIHSLFTFSIVSKSRGVDPPRAPTHSCTVCRPTARLGAHTPRRGGAPCAAEWHPETSLTEEFNAKRVWGEAREGWVSFRMSLKL